MTGQNLSMFFPLSWPFLALWIGLTGGQAPSAAAPVPPCADPGSICAEFDAASVVFTGTVLSVSPEPIDADSRAVRLQTVVFDVTEGFKGTAGGTTSLDFNIASTQERRFSVGETVVVYLHGSAKTRWTTSCTRTRRIAAEDGEAKALRELARGTAGGALEGSMHVFVGTRPPSLPISSLLDHVDVTAEAVDRKETFAVQSQAGGYFVFPWLEPGRYRIRLSSELYAPVARDIVIEQRQRCLILPSIQVQQR